MRVQLKTKPESPAVDQDPGQKINQTAKRDQSPVPDQSTRKGLGPVTGSVHATVTANGQRTGGQGQEVKIKNPRKKRRASVVDHEAETDAGAKTEMTRRVETGMEAIQMNSENTKT